MDTHSETKSGISVHHENSKVLLMSLLCAFLFDEK